MNIKERVKDHYNDLLKLYPEDQIFFIALQGSQNYEMADEESDVDTKAVIIPSLDEIVKAKDPVSYTYVRENDEHIDIKDIRLMFKQYLKQNINFVETLFTEYYIVNEKYRDLFEEIISFREQIARYDEVRAMRSMDGMIHEKLHALTHRYPSREEYIDKYGYDPKQLSHIFRVLDFMIHYEKGDPYKQCLVPSIKDMCMAFKRGEIAFSTEGAVELAENQTKLADEIKDKFVENYIGEKLQEVEDRLFDIQYKVIKRKLKDDLEAAWD